MENCLHEALLTIVGVATTALCLLLWRGIKWLGGIKKNVESMVINGECRRKENRVQFQMLKAQSRASRTLLEVVAKNQNNGNVERAFFHLDESDKMFDDYTDEMLKGV